MSRYLITFKPEKYQTPTHSYAVLAEIDWSSKLVVRQVRFPMASYSHADGYFAPLVGGVCQVGSRVFVALYNCVVELDYDSFHIVNSFSHPYMVDLHGVACDGDRLYVASTGIDAVLGFDINRWELEWRWGPDEPILYADRLEADLTKDARTSLPIIGERIRQRHIQRQIFRDKDYRHMRKGMTEYHQHHVNDLVLHEGRLYVTTKQWNHSSKGAVLQVDLGTGQSRFFVTPDTLDGLHDGVWCDDRFYVTESGANQVAWVNVDGQVTHQPVEPSPYFVRGLCDTGDSWLVGFTTQRGTDLPARIIEFNRDFTKRLGEMTVSEFYPIEKGTAIHGITRVEELAR